MTQAEQPIKTAAHPQQGSKRAWLVVFVAALFFFYEFIQLNMFNSIDAQLMQRFHVDATELGVLSSSYFISNIIFLIPAGILLDRFSTKKLILITMSICVLGIFLLSQSTDLTLAAFYRFLSGVGSAFCFLSSVRLATRWFPPQRMALVSGLIVTMAMLGGMVAQTPFTLLVAHIGLLKTLYVDVAFGIFILALMAIFIKNAPDGYVEPVQTEDALKLSTSLKASYGTLKNWFAGVYTSLMNLPIFLLGALWGSLYLSQVHGLNREKASIIASMIFLGTTIGSPLMGFISDRLGRRKPPMLIGAMLTFANLLAIMYLPNLSFTELTLLFLSLGFITSTQVISYPLVAESNPRRITATAISVISISTIGGGALFQPFFGWLMSIGWEHKRLHGIAIYSIADFQRAMMIMPAAVVIAFVLALCVKETYCKATEHV